MGGTSSCVMRARRLHQHGSLTLQAAVKNGLITVYRAGEITKLPASEQEIVVTQWTNRSLRRARGQAIASRVIREELTRGDSQIDLDRIFAAIRAAVALEHCTLAQTDRNQYHEL